MNKLVTAADLLDEYGSALRGSWGDIDGRSEQASLSHLSDAIRTYGGHVNLSWSTIVTLRENLDVCPAGNGHWTEFCDDECDTTK